LNLVSEQVKPALTHQAEFATPNLVYLTEL